MFLWNETELERKISWPIRRYYHVSAHLPLVESVKSHEHKTNTMK
jgi:hypothetical protein